MLCADLHDEAAKERRAISLFSELRCHGDAVLSTQVLQEFVNVALRKLRLPLPLVRERLAFYRRFDLVQTTPDLIAGALDLHALHSLSFHDALIVQAASVSSCPRLLSDDLQEGAVIARVRVENPFTC